MSINVLEGPETYHLDSMGVCGVVSGRFGVGVSGLQIDFCGHPSGLLVVELGF